MNIISGKCNAKILEWCWRRMCLGMYLSIAPSQSKPKISKEWVHRCSTYNFPTCWNTDNPAQDADSEGDQGKYLLINPHKRSKLIVEDADYQIKWTCSFHHFQVSSLWKDQADWHSGTTVPINPAHKSKFTGKALFPSLLVLNTNELQFHLHFNLFVTYL